MFGAICAGRPVQTNLQAVSETQFIFHLPSPSTLNHIVVFLLPEAFTLLPATHGATVHIQFPGRPFRLLGAISLQKPSAIFRVRSGGGATSNGGGGGGVDDMMDGAQGTGGLDEGEVILGISVEPLESVQAQLATLATGAQGQGESAGALVKHVPAVTMTVLARRIIKNAFNFLSGFASGGAGGDVVPLKAFQEWWVKFERKIEHDPTFLERDE